MRNFANSIELLVLDQLDGRLDDWSFLVELGRGIICFDVEACLRTAIDLRWERLFKLITSEMCQVKCRFESLAVFVGKVERMATFTSEGQHRGSLLR